MKFETHSYPPEIHEKFDKWSDATEFLRKSVDECVDAGYWFRAVELSHEHDWVTDKDVIHVWIRRFPKIVADLKADKIILEAMCGFEEKPPRPRSLGKA